MTSLQMPKFECAKAFPQPNISLARKLGSEFLGSFIMVFGAAAASIVNQKYYDNIGAQTLIGNAVSSGLAVMVVILSTGHISGAHINPAVTIAFAALRHFPWPEVVPYIIAQVLGSLSAGFALKGVFHPYFMSGGVTVPSVGHGQAFAVEFILTFILMFVITSLATDNRAVGDLAAMGIGATVVLDILIAGPVTGASMNPIRTLGPAVATGNYKGVWIYLAAPPLGALAGALAYTLIKISDRPPNQVRDDFISRDTSARFEPSLPTANGDFQNAHFSST